jgi:hypothetical protein
VTRRSSSGWPRRLPPACNSRRPPCRGRARCLVRPPSTIVRRRPLPRDPPLGWRAVRCLPCPRPLLPRRGRPSRPPALPSRRCPSRWRPPAGPSRGPRSRPRLREHPRSPGRPPPPGSRHLPGRPQPPGRPQLLDSRRLRDSRHPQGRPHLQGRLRRRLRWVSPAPRLPGSRGARFLSARPRQLQPRRALRPSERRHRRRVRSRACARPSRALVGHLWPGPRLGREPRRRPQGRPSSTRGEQPAGRPEPRPPRPDLRPRPLRRRAPVLVLPARRWPRAHPGVRRLHLPSRRGRRLAPARRRAPSVRSSIRPSPRSAGGAMARTVRPEKQRS